ncbi:beta-galactosidase [Roseofilum sp. BLCC_M91]|uniref:Beta-galactosidase n=1 Tax=Roseofilum halophilum BLCC-M91 TaxID=3022259 RepID=A0ABT7BN20_9CYAN|nr:sugar-binding domain-containing protein [Roseofilum halophilum]MDJ1180585.1 beta-galactosidase [Roseofilum halophilum BLCC-M91]
MVGKWIGWFLGFSLGAIAVIGLSLIPQTAPQTPIAHCGTIQVTSYPPLTEVPENGDRPRDAQPYRPQLYLNGVWDFQPAIATSPTPPQSNWGKIRVPGDWRRENAKSVPGILSRGTGNPWRGFNGETLAQAWYQKQVNIPPEWQGRRILLSLERVSTDANLYVNNQACGAVNWPYGAVDITSVVNPGQNNNLSLLVRSIPDDDKTVIMGPNEIYTTEAKLAARGLIGEVRLLSIPQGAFISDVFVQPSTRKKQVTVDVELTDITQAGSVEITATMLDEQGKIEREFTTTQNVKSQSVQTLNLTWNWDNPRLWDVEQPNLYTLRLQVKGEGIEDTYDQSFGFREFWIEGKKFYLNGTEIRLRPVYHNDNWQGWAVGIPEVMDNMIEGYQESGFNIAEVWPWNHDERGRWHFRELFSERADLKGFPIMAPALDAGISGYALKWRKPEGKRLWESRMVTELRRYRNHPSILMWANSPNFFAPKGDDQNPRRLGKRKVEGTLGQKWDRRWRERKTIGEDVVKTIKEYDRTRPVLIHNGAAIGDVYALNSYLNLIPLQEREEWLSNWVEEGDMPYMVVEFGTPLHGVMMRGRYGLLEGSEFEPLMTEYSAIYLGKKAYDLETSAYRSQIRQKFVKDQVYESWHFNPELDFAPAFQELQSLFSSHTWRSWRIWGITGGMIPWHDGHGWQVSEEGKERVSWGAFESGDRGVYLEKIPKYFQSYFQSPGFNIYPGGEAILANNGPTLAWIAGESGNFVSKDRSYEGQSVLKKQVVLINDTRESKFFSFEWEVKVGNRVVESGENQGQIASAKTLFFPIEVTLPRVEGKVDGAIALQAQVGSDRHQDKFEFRVFSGSSEQNLPQIAIFDPVGKTTQMLTGLGYRVTPWDGFQTSDLVAIAREALSTQAESTLKELLAQLEPFVEKGGRVMIFTQNPQWIHGTLGFRVAPHLSRRVFPLQENHPLLQGLDSMDLRDWRGESTLVEAYPDTTKTEIKRSPPRNLPWYGWHWGNQGVVSSASLEKPHRSSWRPILESEFDLAYSPLMELDYGRGRVILTTLDFEDGVKSDPAARKLLHQAIAYAAQAPLSPKAQRVVFIGTDAQAQQLDQLGVMYQRSNQLTPDVDLAIIGSQVSLEDGAIREYLQQGGRLFFLSRTPQSPRILDLEIANQPQFSGSLAVPSWPEAGGLSASDLRSRTDYSANLISSGGEISSDGLFSRVQMGTGVAIFCQLDPQGLNADRFTYFRYTRWRHTRAISQILANLGASFRADGALFANLQKPPKRVHLSEPVDSEFYHPDYRTDFELGDDPYRYSLW